MQGNTRSSSMCDFRQNRRPRKAVNRTLVSAFLSRTDKDGQATRGARLHQVVHPSVQALKVRFILVLDARKRLPPLPSPRHEFNQEPSFQNASRLAEGG